jgi:Pentapeptide repeats (9 copies)/Pentapeptide repeats (8 copies)
LRFLKSIGVQAPIITLALAFLLALWKIPEQQVKYLPLGEKRVELENSSRATLAQTLGGAILLAGLYFTWRNLLVTEEKQITERFTKAIELLGSKEKDIRLGGIYALERIAKDSPKDHWTIMEILTSYVRDKSSRFKEGTEVHFFKRVKTRIPDYDAEIQAILTVLGRRNIPKGMEEQNLDLKSADLSGFTFSQNSNFANTNFREANLSKATLKGAIFTSADFSDANLWNADLGSADFRKADLRYANLSAAKCNATKLDAARLESTFLCEADLRESSLISANLSEAHLSGARFNKADLSKAIFTEAGFADNPHWEIRHWSEEDLWSYEYMLREQEENRPYNPYDYDDNYDDDPHWRVDFRQSNLTSSQAKVAKNMDAAVYDDALQEELGLPEQRMGIREI